MTTIQISLPDRLAEEAQRAGLLSPEVIAKLLREQLANQRVSELFSAMERVSASEDTPEMTPEELTEEIAAMRAERRANAARTDR